MATENEIKILISARNQAQAALNQASSQLQQLQKHLGTTSTAAVKAQQHMASAAAAMASGATKIAQAHERAAASASSLVNAETKAQTSANALAQAQARLQAAYEKTRLATERMNSAKTVSVKHHQDLITATQQEARAFAAVQTAMAQNKRATDDLARAQHGLAQAEAKVAGELDKINAPLQRQSANFKAIGNEIRNMGMAMTVGLTLPIAAGAKSILEIGNSFDQAFAGVRKTVEGTDEFMGNLRQSIRDMAKELPASREEIAAVIAFAGQLGIHADQVEDFAEAMIRMGESSDLAAMDAADAFARWANITQLPQEQIGRLAATVAGLGIVSASTESEIVRMGLRIAGAAKQIGLTDAEIAAFASTLASLGVRAELGGSTVSRVFADIGKAVAQGGEMLDKFAEVAGMTAEQFRQKFQTDAAGGVVAFIQGLQRIQAEGGDLFTLFEDLGEDGVRLRDILLRLTSSGDLLTRQLGVANEEFSKGDALMKISNERFQTVGAQWEMLKNRITDVAVTLFEAFIPAMMSGVDILKGAADKLGQFAEAFAGLSDTVKISVVAFLAATAAVGPLAIAIGTLITFMGGPAVAIMAGVVVAIGLLTVGLVALARNWDDFSKKMPQTFEALGKLGDIFKSIGQIIIELVPHWISVIVGFVKIIAGAALIIINAWVGVGSIILAALRGDFGKIPGIAREAAAGVKEAFLLSAEGFEEVGMGYVDAYGEVLDGIDEKSKSVFENVGKYTEEELSKSADKIKAVQDALGKAFQSGGIEGMRAKVTSLAIEHGMSVEEMNRHLEGLQTGWDVATFATDHYGFIVDIAMSRATNSVQDHMDHLRSLEPVFQGIGVRGESTIKELMTQFSDGGFQIMDQLVSAMRKGEVGFDEVVSSISQSGKVTFQQMVDKIIEMKDTILAEMANPENAAIFDDLKNDLAILDHLYAEVIKRQAEWASASTPNAHTVHAAFDSVKSGIQQQMQYWGNLKTEAENALEVLSRMKDEQGGVLTPEQQRMWENFNWLIGRSTGGMEDMEEQQLKVLDAQTEWIRKLDELNSKRKDLGEEEYNKQLQDLASNFQGMLDPTGNLNTNLILLAGAIENLRRAILGLPPLEETFPPEVNTKVNLDTADFDGDKKVTRDEMMDLAEPITAHVALEPEKFLTEADIALKKGKEIADQKIIPMVGLATEVFDDKVLIAKGHIADIDQSAPEVLVTAKAQDAITNLQSVLDIILMMPSEFHVTAVAHTEEAEAKIEGFGALVPRSPAKRGPFSKKANWNWVFEGLPVAAKTNTEKAVASLDVGFGELASSQPGSALSSVQQYRDFLTELITMLADASASIGEGVEHAKAFAETGKVAVETFLAAMDLVARLSEESVVFGENAHANLEALNHMIYKIVRLMAQNSESFSEEYLTSAKLFAESANAASQAYTAGIDLLLALSEEMLVFGEREHANLEALNHMLYKIVRLMAQNSESLAGPFLEDVKKLSEAVQSAVAAFTAVVDLLKALNDETAKVAIESGNYNSYLVVIAMWARRVSDSFEAVIKIIEEEQSGQISRFSQAVQDSVGALAAVVDFLVALNDEAALVAIEQGSIAGKVVVLSLQARLIGDAFKAVTPVWNEQITTDISGFSQAVQDATSGLITVLDFLTRLLDVTTELDLTSADVADAAIRLAGMARIIGDIFEGIAPAWGGDEGATTRVGGFAQSVQDATASMISVLDFLRRLLEVTDEAAITEEEVRAAAERMSRLAWIIADAFARASDAWIVGAHPSLTEFAEAATASLDVVTKVNDALHAIVEFGQVGNIGNLTAKVDQMIIFVELILAAIKTVSDRWNAVAVDELGAFSEDVAKSVDLMAGVAEAMNSIAKVSRLSKKHVEVFVHNFEVILGLIRELNSMSKGYVADALEFKAIAEAIAAALKAAAEAIQEVTGDMASESSPQGISGAPGTSIGGSDSDSDSDSPSVGPQPLEFDFKISELNSVIQTAVEGLGQTLEHTYADNLSNLVNTLNVEGGSVSEEMLGKLTGILGEELSALGISDPASIGTQLLKQLGLSDQALADLGLTKEEIDELKTTLGTDFLDGADSVVGAIQTSANQIVQAIENQGSGGGGGGGGGKTSLSMNHTLEKINSGGSLSASGPASYGSSAPNVNVSVAIDGEDLAAKTTTKIEKKVLMAVGTRR